MRVLYAGPLNQGGTCYSRYIGLQRLGLEVIPFDIEQWLDLSRIPKVWRWIELLSLCGPRIALANAAFAKAAKESRPDVVWIDKGYWLWPATIDAAKSPQSCWVHHNTDYLHTDNRRMRWSRRLMVQTADRFDAFLTTNHDDYARYRRLLGHRARLTQLGYDDDRFNASPLPPDLQHKWKADVVFIGHYEPRTEVGVAALAEAGIDVRVYGAEEWHRSRFAKRFPARVGRPLDDRSYVEAIKGAKMGLCIFSAYNNNQTAGRSFEIPACGTMLLGLRSPQHLECYKEGEEAAFFTTPADLVTKARYYLANDDQRCLVAKKGNQRCLLSGYSWAAIMQRDWESIVRLRDKDRSIMY